MLRVGAVLAGLAAVATGELLKQHTFDQPFQEFDALGAWRGGPVSRVEALGARTPPRSARA